MAHIAGQGRNSRSSVRAESPASTSGLIEYIQRSNHTIKLLQEELHTTSQFAFKFSNKYEAKRAERDQVASQLAAVKRQCDKYTSQLQLVCEFITQQCKHETLPDAVAAIVAEHVNFTNTASGPSEQQARSKSSPPPAGQHNPKQVAADTPSRKHQSCSATPPAAAASSGSAAQQETSYQPPATRHSARTTTQSQVTRVTPAAGNSDAAMCLPLTAAAAPSSQHLTHLEAAAADNGSQQGRVPAAPEPSSATQNSAHGNITTSSIQPQSSLTAAAAIPAGSSSAPVAQQLDRQLVRDSESATAAAADRQFLTQTHKQPAPRAPAEAAAEEHSSRSCDAAAGDAPGSSIATSMPDNVGQLVIPVRSRALQAKRRQQGPQRSRPLTSSLEPQDTIIEGGRAKQTVESTDSSRAASSDSQHLTATADPPGGDAVANSVSVDLEEVVDRDLEPRSAACGDINVTETVSKTRQGKCASNELTATGRQKQAEVEAAADAMTCRQPQLPSTLDTESRDSNDDSSDGDSSSGSSADDCSSSSTASDGDSTTSSSSADSDSGGACQGRTDHQQLPGVDYQQSSAAARRQSPPRRTAVAAQQTSQQKQLSLQERVAHVDSKSSSSGSSSDDGSDTEQLSSNPSKRSADLKRSENSCAVTPRSRRSSQSSMYSACSRSTRTSQASLAAAASLVELDNFGLLLEQMSSGVSQQAYSADGTASNTRAQRRILGVRKVAVASDADGNSSSSTTSDEGSRRVSAAMDEAGCDGPTHVEAVQESADTQPTPSVSRSQQTSPLAICTSTSARSSSTAVAAAAERAAGDPVMEPSHRFVSEGGSVFGFVGNAFSNLQHAVATAGNVRAAAAAVMGALPGSRAGTEGGTSSSVDHAAHLLETAAATAVLEKQVTPTVCQQVTSTGVTGFSGFSVGAESSSAAHGGSTAPGGTRRRRLQARHTPAVNRFRAVMKHGSQQQTAAKAEHSTSNSADVQCDSNVSQQPAQSSPAETPPVSLPCTDSPASSGEQQQVAVARQQLQVEVPVVDPPLARSSSGGRWSSWLGGLAAVGAALSPQRTSSCSPSPTGAKTAVVRHTTGGATPHVAHADSTASHSSAAVDGLSKTDETDSQAAQGRTPEAETGPPAADMVDTSFDEVGSSSTSEEEDDGESVADEGSASSDSCSDSSSDSDSGAEDDTRGLVFRSRFDALEEEGCSEEESDSGGC